MLRGEKLDLSDYRDDILYLSAVGIHTKRDLTDTLQCNPNGVLVIYEDGRQEHYLSENTFGGPDWATVPDSAKRFAWPHVQIIKGNGEPDVVFDLPFERVGELAKFQDYVNNNSNLCYFDTDDGQYKDTKLCDDKLIDCCYAYDFQERLRQKLSNVPVKKKPIGKLKL